MKIKHIMKINHIVDRNWALYWDKKVKESNIYDLRVYRLKKDSSYGYRYRLVFHKKNYYMDILATDSKEEIKITLNLMGLRIEKGRIFMKVDSTGKITIIGLLIDLIEK